MSTPNLAPHEWLAGAKEYVRASLFAGEVPVFQSLVADGVRRYGPAFRGQLQHSLALSCMMAKRHDLARPLLRTAIAATADSRNHFWSKAVWALGRMESLLGNHAAAAESFAQVAQATQVPERFRLQARLLWAENLLASGDEEGLRACAAELPALLAEVQDYNTLLDFARQLSRAGGELRSLADQVYARGESTALQGFASATHPAQALDMLFKLTRRQVYDFGRAAEVLAFWRALPGEKKLWLWNNDNRWWGYLSFVLLAHLDTGDLAGAASLAQATLDDPATPRTALPSILVPYYDEIARRGRAAEALAAFEWIVTENPTASGCATAYSWLAVAAYSRGDAAAVARLTENLLISNAHTDVTYDKWMFEAKARLLQAGLDPAKISTQVVNFDSKFLQKALRRLRDDLHFVSL